MGLCAQVKAWGLMRFCWGNGGTCGSVCSNMRGRIFESDFHIPERQMDKAKSPHVYVCLHRYAALCVCVIVEEGYVCACLLFLLFFPLFLTFPKFFFPFIVLSSFCISSHLSCFLLPFLVSCFPPPSSSHIFHFLTHFLQSLFLLFFFHLNFPVCFHSLLLFCTFLPSCLSLFFFFILFLFFYLSFLSFYPFFSNFHFFLISHFLPSSLLFSPF